MTRERKRKVVLFFSWNEGLTGSYPKGRGAETRRLGRGREGLRKEEERGEKSISGKGPPTYHRHGEFYHIHFIRKQVVDKKLMSNF